MEAVCDILGKDNVAGAQTGRSGVVQAGEGFAWRRSLTGRLFSLPVLLVRQPPFRCGGVGGILSQMFGFTCGAKTMTLTIEAIYENGVLKPAQPLPLKEHEKVRITVEPERTWAERTAGMLQWTGDPEVLRRIAEDDEFGILESP